MGRFTQPEPAWSNPMFNTLGGRNLLARRAYATKAAVGQGTAPMPAGYYGPIAEYNWYSYAGNDPVNLADPSGYQYGEVQSQVIAQIAIWGGLGLWIIGVAITAGGLVTSNLELVPAGVVVAGGGYWLTARGFELMEGGEPWRSRPPAPQIGPFKIPRVR